MGNITNDGSLHCICFHDSPSFHNSLLFFLPSSYQISHSVKSNICVCHYPLMQESFFIWFSTNWCYAVFAWHSFCSCLGLLYVRNIRVISIARPWTLLKLVGWKTFFHLQWTEHFSPKSCSCHGRLIKCRFNYKMQLGVVAADICRHRKDEASRGQLNTSLTFKTICFFFFYYSFKWNDNRN